MIKRIFFPFSGQKVELAAARVALSLANRLDARVTAMFITHTLDALAPHERAIFDRMRERDGYTAAMGYLETVHLDGHARRASEARRNIEALFEQEGASGRLSWREQVDVFASSGDELRYQGWLHDLTIGSRHLSPTVYELLVNDVMFSTGRPILLVPSHGHAIDEIRAVLAWKPTAQTLHATMAAMPFLRLASVCHVTAVVEDAPDRQLTPSPAEFAAYVAEHGVPTEAHTLTATSESAPLALSRFIVEKRANLVVMGAYSQSRLRQLVFGGFTRHFLTNQDNMLLMSH